MNSEQITAFLQEHWYIASVLIGAVILIMVSFISVKVSINNFVEKITSRKFPRLLNYEL